MRTPGSVPATPLYALMIRTDQAHGLALTLDGEQIAAGPDIEALRASGLAELRVRAALAGRPVRARAVEPASPIPWNMIVSPDGTVVDVAEHPAAPAPVTEDNRLEPADSRGTPEAEPSAPPARTAADASAQAALPALLGSEAYREMWAAAWAAHRTGDLPAAVALAYKLETTLVEQVGDMHPATVTVLTARAWLTLCQRTELRETTELLIVTALRCRATRYRPEADTIRTARNAHACWHLLRKESPEQAAALAGRLADMLAILGEDDRRRDVLTWNGVLPAG
ncbi:hypothetical protein [Streptomyces virginiae]|uniref:Uncharacterized protein n=1 Tax=Streptomyces virginiae TaxID=1961 RepID=A0ABZ1TUP4_STRVG|nr:hypothetical protein [Streptomyces virginiae]